MKTRRRKNFPEITDPQFWDFYDRAAPFSMVQVTGFYNVYQSMLYVARNGIPGDMVECGCFLGGIGIFIGLLRRRLGLTDRTIHLFDTFEGPPDGEDVFKGRPQRTGHRMPDYHDTVFENIAETLGSADGFMLTKGLVEDTLPKSAIGPLSLARFDTDHYSSTRTEFEILYPKIVQGGVIIVDDYGLFQGARRATDEYLSGLSSPPLLNRIDQGVWAGVKP
jgi:hypothetical protein